MTFTPLILAGGKSTRMKSPKHLLPMPDGRPLYQHLIDHLHHACPDAPTIYISLALDSERDDFLRAQPTATAPVRAAYTKATSDSNDPALTTPQPPSAHPLNPPLTSPSPQTQLPNNQPNIKIIMDHPPPTILPPSPSPPKLPLTASPPTPTQMPISPPPPPSSSSSGPATGLLSAHALLPKTTFLVVACDHPFLTPALLHRLCARYVPPVTCFRNRAGFAEPLVAVWGPEALRVLKGRLEEVEGGVEGDGRGKGKGKGRGVGPARVVREVGGLLVDVGEVFGVGGGGIEGEVHVGRGLEGVNTPEEWEAAVRVLKGEGKGGI